MNLSALVDALREAIQIGESLGLDELVDPARETLSNAVDRQGFPGEAFVLALIGGTGVGKSTLLNEIAGQEVSVASVVRPTTDRPRAWVGRERLEEVSPLLEWLGVDQVVTYSDEPLEGVVLLDMPDFDSIVTDHRLRVERLLPRLDSLLWVVDPEKYDDERLYEYLRVIGPRADSFHIVLNKIDRLNPDEREMLSKDLMRRLIEAGVAGAVLHLVSAASGEGVGELVAMLKTRAEAKREIYNKIRSEAQAAIGEIAEVVGDDESGDGSSLSSAGLDVHRSAVVATVMDLVDVEGIRRQVTSAYLERAKMSAGSMLGRLGALGRLVLGQRRRNADPVRYIRDWRSRGDLSRAVLELRQAYLDSTADIPVAGRAGMLARMDPDAATEDLTAALDDALSKSAADLEIRTPLLWKFLSVLQLIGTLGILVAVAWYVTIWISPAELPVGTIEVPEVGPVPVPLALLVVSGVLSLLVGWVVGLHASWRGRREAGRVAAGVASRVAGAIDRHGFEPIAQLRADLDRLSELSELVRTA